MQVLLYHSSLVLMKCVEGFLKCSTSFLIMKHELRLHWGVYPDGNLVSFLGFTCHSDPALCVAGFRVGIFFQVPLQKFDHSNKAQNKFFAL